MIIRKCTIDIISNSVFKKNAYGFINEKSMVFMEALWKFFDPINVLQAKSLPIGFIRENIHSGFFFHFFKNKRTFAQISEHSKKFSTKCQWWAQCQTCPEFILFAISGVKKTRRNHQSRNSWSTTESNVGTVNIDCCFILNKAKGMFLYV